jgi:hypothetical protein
VRIVEASNFIAASYITGAGEASVKKKRRGLPDLRFSFLSMTFSENRYPLFGVMLNA